MMRVLYSDILAGNAQKGRAGKGRDFTRVRKTRGRKEQQRRASKARMERNGTRGGAGARDLTGLRIDWPAHMPGNRVTKFDQQALFASKLPLLSRSSVEPLTVLRNAYQSQGMKSLPHPRFAVSLYPQPPFRFFLNSTFYPSDPHR